MGNLTEVANMGKSATMLILILLAQPVLIVRAEAAPSARVDVRIIAVLESGGDPLAYNAHEQAYGAFQIRQCVIMDYNTAGPGRSRPLILTDMYDDFLSEVVADWYVNEAIPKYLTYYRVQDTVDNRLIAYNMGVTALASGRKIPALTRAYVRMYHEIIKRGE